MVTECAADFVFVIVEHSIGKSNTTTLRKFIFSN